MKGFYFITDASLSRAGNISDVKSALAAKVKVIQYREKHASIKEMFEEALVLRKLCKTVTFLIDDRVDIALGVGADGVHLGKDDMPFRVARKILGKKKIIGLTVHSLQEAEEAQNMGADYIGVSPIFATQTKSDAGRPLGAELLKRIRRHISIPLVAIGGINLNNACEVIGAGADALCALSAVLRKRDVTREILKFQNLFHRAAAREPIRHKPHG